jgi:hypothetical protein
MGLLDKAKQQATQLAQKGQEAAQKGQGKLQEAQDKKRADALFRDLGAAVFAQRSGRDGGSTAEVDRLVAEITEHEAAHGAVDTAATAGQPPGETTEGSYSIDDV